MEVSETLDRLKPHEPRDSHSDSHSEPRIDIISSVSNGVSIGELVEARS